MCPLVEKIERNHGSIQDFLISPRRKEGVAFQELAGTLYKWQFQNLVVSRSQHVRHILVPDSARPFQGTFYRDTE
jgi:hypothetical protein